MTKYHPLFNFDVISTHQLLILLFVLLLMSRNVNYHVKVLKLRKSQGKV